MKLPRSGHGRLGLEVIELADHERQPMIQIPEYLERRRSAVVAAEAAAVSAAEAVSAAAAASAAVPTAAPNSEEVAP